MNSTEGEAETVYRLGKSERYLKTRLDHWRKDRFLPRLWAKDPTLWAAGPVPEIADRLGWLELSERMAGRLAGISAFAEEVRTEGFHSVVLLGMGGSSLGPDVFQKTFGNAPGYPELIVLDSTHPAAVAAVEKKIGPRKTLFIVSSKSGTTIEPLSFFRYFWGVVERTEAEPGRHFAAVTDPGTVLIALARERKFRRVFKADPDVGGRFSALTEFGLVPAALIGVGIRRLLRVAGEEALKNSPAANEEHAPALRLGAAIGEIGRKRDKLTILTSPRLRSFPDWIEQLIAESLGKDGQGVLPVVGEPALAADHYGRDRMFVALLLDGDDNEDIESRLDALENNSLPVIRIRLANNYDLGREIFRWEIATAAAGAVLRVHPFNQPNVDLAKDLARQAMVSGAATSGTDRDDTAGPGDPAAFEQWLKQARPDDYIAVQAFLDPDEETARSLAELREALLKKTRLATTLGFGPRFLHSTGQYHKGGPDEGLFLQLVDEPAFDLAVPETDTTFGRLIHAQAAGDAQALRQSGRRVLRINLGRDVAGGLDSVRRLFS